jgi:hypothetical protein
MDRRRKAAMDTEDLIVDDHAQGKEIKHVGEVMPYICIAIFACAFSVKTVRLSDAS